MPIKKKKIIIVGAGYAGLALGALMAKVGHEVIIYEAHTYIGGCASFFKRRKFTFDAGATTLSGLGANRPLAILNQHLEISPKFRKLEKPMCLHLKDGRKILRSANLDDWIETLEREFPGHHHQIFWYGLKKREEDLWTILAQGQYFPPNSIKDFLKLLTPELLKRTPLGLWAFTPFSKTIPQSMRKDQALMDLINEQLIISTQSHAKEVPALLAAMGLIYPDDMYYADGGITSYGDKLAEVIENHGGKIYKRHQVKHIEKIGPSFTVSGDAPAGKVFKENSDLVVSNLTVWDTPRLFNDKESKLFKVQKERGAWSAVTGYFAVKAIKPIEPLYHQVHYHHPEFGKGSFFFSFSHPQDELRAPEGMQTVTVSTHTRTRDWPNKEEKEAYDQLKKKFGDFITEVFESEFSANEIVEKTDIEIGSPHTFKRFTGRNNGLVGGLPHNLRNNILTFPTQETPIKGLYQIGDTTFPGQGIVGVITGALMLAGKINNTNYLK